MSNTTKTANTRKTAAKKAAAKENTVKNAAKPAPAKTAKPANCACRCGKPTITAKATFLPGHDARHAGNLGRAAAAGEDVADALAALTPALRAKAESVAETAIRKQNVKEAREAAKKAYAAAMADATA